MGVRVGSGVFHLRGVCVAIGQWGAAIGEVGEQCHEQFSGDGPEAEEYAKEPGQGREDSWMGEVQSDETCWEDKLECGDEDGLTDADAAGHEEADGEAHGPCEAIGAGEDVPFLEGQLEGAVGEDPNGEALPEQAEDIPEDDDGEFAFS